MAAPPGVAAAAVAVVGPAAATPASPATATAMGEGGPGAAEQQERSGQCGHDESLVHWPHSLRWSSFRDRKLTDELPKTDIAERNVVVSSGDSQAVSGISGGGIGNC